MEHQELERLATTGPPLEVDDSDEEYKVESDAEADDTDSDEGDELEALPRLEETLHLLGIADDILGSIEEEVFSDSECEERDSEDEDDNVITDAGHVTSKQQIFATEVMAGHTVGRVSEHAQVAGAAPGCPCIQSCRRDAEQVEAIVGAPGGGSMEAPREFRNGQDQQLPVMIESAGVEPNWSMLGYHADTAPLHQHVRQAPSSSGALGIAAEGLPTEYSSPSPPQRHQQVPLLYNYGYAPAQLHEEPAQQQESLAVETLPMGQGLGHLLDPRIELEHVPACPPSGSICRRTRAHVSLRNVELAELEQQLPKHIDLEEIELAEDDEEYGKFLQALFDDTATLPEDSSDEDPDFAADLYLELEGNGREDDDDHAWLRLLNSSDVEDDRNAIIGLGSDGLDSPTRRTRARSRRANPKDVDAAAAASSEGVIAGFPVMTAEQLSILHAQVHCHTQMLLQAFAMLAGDPDSEARDLVAKVKAMLDQLVICRDAQSLARRLLGLASYTPEDLLRPAQQQPAATAALPADPTGLATIGGGVYGDKAAVGSGTTEGAGRGAAATVTSDPNGRDCIPVQVQGPQQSAHPAILAASASTTSLLGHSEASQDEVSVAGYYEWEHDVMGSTATGNSAMVIKAAAVARSALLTSSILTFRPTWCVGPTGGVWSVLDVVPLRKFPEVQAILHGLPVMQHSTLREQRTLQVVNKSRRKNRRRRGDDPGSKALEWARPALQCLKDHLLPSLVYTPSSPVPPSYWTTAEDELMVYGMTRHGTNWRLIAETLLISRNASQIANRFKNVNARRRNVDDVPLEGLADMQQQQAQPGPSGQAAPLRRSRALLPAPAARTDRQPSGTTVGSVGAYMGQAAGPCALARHGVLQTATAVSAAGAAAGGSAGWAAVAPSSLPPAAAPAAVMQATRAVGLQPAIAAATIMQAKKQVRPQPQVAIPPVRVPLSVALQLVAQLQASGGLSGPAAATVSLLAAQLQVPSTTPVDIGALLRAIQQAIPQPATNTSAPVVGALGAMGKLPAGHLATSTSTSAVLGPGLQGAGTSYGQRSGATGGELGAPSMVALVAQLLRRAGVSQTSTLTLPVPQQTRMTAGAPQMMQLISGTPAGISLPLLSAPSVMSQLQQYLPALFSLGQPAAPLAAPTTTATVAVLPDGGAVPPAVAPISAAAATQAWAAQTSCKAGAASGAASEGGDGANNGHAAMVAVDAHDRNEAMDVPFAWPDQEHGHEDTYEPMHWMMQSPPLRSAHDAAAGLASMQHDGSGSGGGSGAHQPTRCQGDNAGNATAVVAGREDAAARPAAAAGKGTNLLQPCVANVSPTEVLGPRGRTPTAAEPTNPRLPHDKNCAVCPSQCPAGELPALEHCADDHLPPPLQQPSEVSPSAQSWQLAAHLHNYHQSQHRQDLPSPSDNYTLGEITELLRSGAATPATFVSSQGGPASASMSLLLGSCLGVSALLRVDADYSWNGGGSPTTIAAGGPPRTASSGHPPSFEHERCMTTKQAMGSPCVTSNGHPNANAQSIPTCNSEGGVVTPRAKQLLQAHLPAPPQARPQLQPPTQLLSPTSPTSVGGAVHRRPWVDGGAAALRMGVHATPSSDPKAKRRSRMATLARDLVAPDAAHDVIRSPAGGAGGRAGAAVYRPRPPLFADVTGASSGAGCNQQNGGDDPHLMQEGLGATGEDGGEWDCAVDDLARARKRLRMDTDADMACIGKAMLRTGGGGDFTQQMAPAQLGVVPTPEMRGWCSVSNSVSASPVKPVAMATRGTADVTTATVAALLTRGWTQPACDVQLEQPQRSTGTGSSGGNKRRSDSTHTSSGASMKRARSGQMNGLAGSSGAATTAGHGEATAEVAGQAASGAPDIADGGVDSGTQKVFAVHVVDQPPSRVTGQKRSRYGAGTKPLPAGKNKEKSAEAFAPGPLAVVDGNAAPADAPKAGTGAAAPGNSCAVAGVLPVSAAPPGPPGSRNQKKAAVAAAKPSAAPPALNIARPPQGPKRKGAASAQRITCTSPSVYRPPCAPPPPPSPSVQQQRPSDQPELPIPALAAASDPSAKEPPPALMPSQDAAVAVPSLSLPTLPPMLTTPRSAAMSEFSYGALSLQSFLLGGDSLDIAFLMPCLSTRSLAAVASTCSPTSHPTTNPGLATATATIASPVTTAVASSVRHSSLPPRAPSAAVTAAPRGNDGTAPPPPPRAPNQPPQPLPESFTSPSRSQLLQLTPFAPSACTLGSLDILPLFSNSTGMWHALLEGSTCATTSRGPAACVVAGSTAGGGETARSDGTLLDPWSRFMSACSPPNQSRAADSAPRLLSSPTRSPTTMISALRAQCGPPAVAPAQESRNTAADDGTQAGPLRASVGAAVERLPAAAGVWNEAVAGGARGVGVAATAGDVDVGTADEVPIAGCRFAEDHNLTPTAHQHPAARTDTLVVSEGAEMSGRVGESCADVRLAPEPLQAPMVATAAMVDIGAARAGDISHTVAPQQFLHTFEVQAADSPASEQGPKEQAAEVADECRPPGTGAGSGLKSPDTFSGPVPGVQPGEQQLLQQNRPMYQAAVAMSGSKQPATGVSGPSLLPPLPPLFHRHGLAPSPVAHPSLESQQSPVPETVRLFGRPVKKPPPIRSPTMPVRPPLLRSPIASLGGVLPLAAPAVPKLQTFAPECLLALESNPVEEVAAAAAPAPAAPAAPAAAASVIGDDNSNSRSRSQPEAATAQQAAMGSPPPLLPFLPPASLHTPAHRLLGGCGGNLLRRLPSPVNTPLGATRLNLNTPLLAVASAIDAPTPIQVPRTAVALAAAAAAAQHTPATVAPAGAFAIPDRHPSAAVAVSLSLTPLLGSAATAARTVGRCVPWDGVRRQHFHTAGAHRPCKSHWASNEDHHDAGQPECAASGMELERQGSGSWRHGAGPCWRGSGQAALTAWGGGGGTDTPGHVTCISKVTRRVLPGGAVEPLAMPSSSVMQPTPQGRLHDCDEEGGEVARCISPYRKAQREKQEDVEDRYEEGPGADDPNDADMDAVMAACHERLSYDEDAEVKEAVEEGVELEPLKSLRPQQAAGAPPPQAAAAATVTDAATAPDVASSGPSWGKEQDQVVMREIFRLGEGPSTWKSISEQLGEGIWSIVAVEARARVLMARMMQLM